MKLRLTFVFGVLMLLLVACSAPAEAEMFPLAAECVECHDDINIDSDTQYSFVADWLNSTHALAATDPFFMAISRSETQELPAASELIQETCAGCHLPMADLQAQATGTSRAFLDYAATPSHELHAVYADGISCMLCHQLADNPTADSTMFLNSGLHIDFTEGTPRNIYGFYTLDAANQQPMEDGIGYYSRQSNAERRLPMCDVCHTLYTPSFDVEGNATGSYLPEQMTTREWLNSTLVNQSCQSCHMPTVADAGPLSNMEELESAIEGRIAAHNFVGANAYLLKLHDNGQGALDEGAATITDFLQNETAELTVNAGREGGNLSLDININSITGHKFPTGFPARRAWLYVTVRDSAGTLLYESGAYNAEGMILDDDGDLVAGTFEPHYQVIDTPGQVQIYESVMLDSEGKVTTTLLQGVLYGKDNRLLPPGFDKTAVVPDIAVIGEAFDDEDFTGGSDNVRYLITLPSGTGQVTVEVQLLYQAMGYRYAQNLREYPSEEQALLLDLMAQVPNEPLLVTGKQLAL